MHKFKSILMATLFVAFVICVAALSDTSARPTKWSRGTQIDAAVSLRDSTIDTLLIRPEDWAIIAKLRSGALQPGVVDSNSFTSAWLNILRSSFVGHADTADVVITSSANSDSSVVTGQLPYRFVMRAGSSTISPLIPSARYAMIIDTADGGGSARIIIRDLTGDESYFVDSAAVVEMINDAAADQSDTVAFSYESDHSATSDLSYATLQTIVVEDSTIDSNSYTPAWKNYLRGSFITWSKTADSLTASAIDDFGQFSSGMKSTYIPTAAQKSAMSGVVTPGATNPFADTTYVSERFVRNFDGKDYPLWFSYHNDPDSVGATGKGYFLIDTVGLGFTITDLSGTRFAIEDSATLRSVITAAVGDYVLKGTGGGPTRFTVAAATPSGGSNLDAWINTNDTTLNVKISGTWVEVASGGGGGGTPTSVSTNSHGVVDADSIAFITRGASISGEWAHTADMYMMNGSNLNVLGEAYLDSVVAYSGDFIRIAQADTLGGLFVIGSVNASKQPDAYIRNLTVSATSDLGVEIDVGTIDPSDPAGTVGKDNTSLNQFEWVYTNGLDMDYNATQGYPTVVIDNGGTEQLAVIMQASNSYIALDDVNIQSENGDITVSSGSVTATNFNTASGPQLSSTGMDLATGDYINAPNGTTIRVQSGAEILVESDISNSFAKVTNTAEQYFLVDSTQKAGLVQACPDPSSSNPFVTKLWIKEYLNRGPRKTRDDIYTNRQGTGPRSLLYYKYPGCDDSLYIGYNNVGIVWPVDTTARPIEWPDTLQKLILPWLIPGYPVGPVHVDTTAHGIMGIDPDGGLPEHIMRVSERYDSLLGNYTGKWPLLRQAVDSLPTISCRLYKEKLAGDIAVNNDTTNVDTFMIGPRMGVTAQKLDFYRGTVAAASDIAASLPSYMTKPGTYVKFEATSASTNRWNKIESWLNDSTFTVFDPIWNKATIDTAATTVTFAVMPTIEVEPPVKGGYVYLPSAITIKDISPVHIKGRDKNTVVLTNVPENGHVATDILFDIQGATINDAYIGMPIIFSNLTFLTDTAGSATNYAIKVSGNAKFENCNIVGRYRQGQKAMIYHEYSISHVSQPTPPSLVFEDCVVASDSNAILIRITGDSTRFQSDGNTYAIAGDSSYIMWAEGNLVFQPTFSFDQFYFNDDSRLFMGTGASTQTNDSVIVMQSQFINQDPAGTGTSRMFNGDWDGVYVNGNNSYNVLVTRPPAKVAEGSMPVDVPFMPKK